MAEGTALLDSDGGRGSHLAATGPAKSVFFRPGGLSAERDLCTGVPGSGRMLAQLDGGRKPYLSGALNVCIWPCGTRESGCTPYGVHPLEMVVLFGAISLAVKSRTAADGGDTPCFAVCALVCDPVGEGERVPAFTRESKRGPFVGEVEKRLGDKIYGGSFAGFSPSADVEGSQRTGKCMYIKARRNQGLRMRCSEQFHWQLKIVLWPREERPLFRRVSRCVRFFSERRVCTRFHPQKRTWAICAKS